MRQFLLYTLLLGMALIHVPKSLLHTCTQDLHCQEQHDNCCDDEQEENDLSFDTEECDLCTYSFHFIDAPNDDRIRIPNAPVSVETVISSQFILIASFQSIQLRGPPNSFSLS